MTDEPRSGFLHRWSRRKVEARQGQRLDDEPGEAQQRDEVEGASRPAEVRRVEPADAPAAGAYGLEATASGAAASGAGVAGADAPRDAGPGAVLPGNGTQQGREPSDEPAPLTLADVDALGRDSDFAPFVSRQVDPRVRNAALKKLFSDPHYNVMDGLDIYIDDYSQLAPLPAPMLRRMASAHALKMFDALTEEDDSSPGTRAEIGHPDKAEPLPDVNEVSADPTPPPPAEQEPAGAVISDAQPAPSGR